MKNTNSYDVIILGVGPAGLQAAIHASRKKASVLLLGKQEKSSLFHAHVENFCCIFKVTGEEMLNVGIEQAKRFGAVILEEDVLSTAPEGSCFKVTTENGSGLSAKSLIIATGTARKRLNVPGEKEFLGKGVSYCVECDANFFKGEDVLVAGGESAAADGVLTLLHDSKTVHMVCQKLDIASGLKEKLRSSRAIIHENAKIKEIFGKNQVEGVVLDDGSRLNVSGVFIELGAKGVMELATSLGIALDDEMKYIRTNKNMETNLPGVFAAGDICGPPWQMAKAVGEGCVAGIAAATFAKQADKT
ncbi:MAG: NAD(P)/FAD-dependent oxidoreductase [Thermodesulfobacteriota bacterium]